MSHGLHLLGLTQFILCSLAHADIPEDDGVELFRGRFHLRDRGLNWKFFSVRPDPHQRSGRVHRTTGNSCLPKAPNVFPMSFMESIWNELVDTLPEGLCCRAAEDLLCGSVEDDDLLFVIDRNDRVHRRTDDADQPLLAIAKGFVSPLALRNIHYRPDCARLIVCFSRWRFRAATDF